MTKPLARALSRAAAVALVAVAGCTSRIVDPPAELVTGTERVVPAEQVRAGEDRFPIEVGGRWGYVDGRGEVVIEPRFALAFPFAEGLARVEEGGRVGFIDPDGAFAIPPRFIDAFDFALGRARAVLPDAERDLGNRSADARQERLAALIDGEGRVVVGAELSEVRDFALTAAGPLAPVQRTRTRAYTPLGLSFLEFLGLRLQATRTWEVLRPDGSVSFRPDDVEDVLNYAGDRSAFSRTIGFWPFEAVRWGYLDAAGRVAIAPRFEAAFGFSEGMAAVAEGGRVGFIDTAGTFAIPPRFEQAGPFVEGRARVREGGRWGFVDRAGNLVIPPQYDAAFDFSDGLALVGSAGRFGFVAPDGAPVLPLQFDYARPFRNGLAYARAGRREGYVDRAGAFVWIRPDGPVAR